MRSLLGAGGMGQVFEALDHQLDRRVAIKVACPGPAVALLRQEARALAAFRHPSLVTVHTLGQHRGLDFLVMERIYGLSLGRHLSTRYESGSAPDVDETIEVITAIAEGLAVVHRAGLAHRDVKPDNVMLTPDHRIVLMDFGLVLPEYHVASQTRIAGSPPYMAPEALDNTVQPGAGRLLDLYALGVVAFEMLTNTLPVRGENVAQLYDQHQTVAVPNIRERRMGIPQKLADIITELLAKDPNDRPQSAEAVAWRLRAMRDGFDEAERAVTIVPESEGLRVLIAEDNKDVARVLQFYVKQILGEAVKIETAVDGEAAMVAIRRREPDLLLLDLHMPKMNGIEVCMALRGERLAERTTIISVSAGAQDDDKQLLYQLGIHHFVEKGTQLKDRLSAAIYDAMGIDKRRELITQY
ncbi:MAG: protein kinase [Myxococcales bacterium]|nr:protein kinase [Myxococcales bacterium]MCB9628630.1 protein kinase [Sandaracinaceae bacterium]